MIAKVGNFSPKVNRKISSSSFSAIFEFFLHTIPEMGTNTDITFLARKTVFLLNKVFLHYQKQGGKRDGSFFSPFRRGDFNVSFPLSYVVSITISPREALPTFESGEVHKCPAR